MYKCTRINRALISSSELTGHIILLKLTEHISLGASTGCTDLLKLTGRTNLRPSTVHIGLLKSTEDTGLQELTTRGQRFTNINRACRFTNVLMH